MYKFLKVFPNGTEKLCARFNSTLDPLYHEYINSCREYKISWKLVDDSGHIRHSEIYDHPPAPSPLVNVSDEDLIAELERRGCAVFKIEK